MKTFKNLTIKKRLILLITSVFFLTLIALIISESRSFKKSSEKIATEIAEMINSNYTAEVEHELKRGVALLNAISDMIQIEKKAGAIQVKNSGVTIMKRFLENNKDITHLFLLTDEHFIYENPGKDFKNDSIRPYTLSFYNSKTELVPVISEAGRYTIDLLKLNSQEYEKNLYISDPFRLNLLETNETVLTIAKPIFDNNKVIGVVGINFSLSEISEIINSILYYDYGTNAKTILITDKKNIVFVSDKPQLSGKNILNLNTSEQKAYNFLKLNKTQAPESRELTGAYSPVDVPNTNITWEMLTIVPQNVLTEGLINEMNMALLIASLIIILGLLSAIFFVKKSFLPFYSIIEATKKISKGEPVSLPKRKNHDEFEKIISAINKISDNLKEAASVSLQIAEGKYNSKIKQKAEDDILSVSINKIAENLKTREEKNRLQEKTTHKQLWMRKGRFEVSEAERKSKNNISDLTFNILQELVNYTGALMGGIYLYDSKNETIKLTASYAYENKKQINKTFKPGEGLVGTCVVEKKKIILNKVPDDYIKIASGIGSGTPTNISLIPVFYQEKINAVIELAFMKHPEEYIIEFIEQLSDNIGAWIDASLINTKTAELLLISREQTKKLAEKEQELNLKVEELQKAQTEIDIHSAENKSIMNAINHTVLTVEYTLDGIVINSNEIYEEVMGFSPDDIKGVSVFEIVKDQKEDLSLIIQKVSEGIPVRRQVKRYTKSGKEKWLSATYTPYYNIDGKITRVLFFAHDITKMKVELDKLKASRL